MRGAKLTLLLLLVLAALVTFDSRLELPLVQSQAQCQCPSPTPTPTPTPEPAPTPSSNTITVDASQTFQTYIRSEATAQGGQSDFSDWNLYKNSLMDQAVEAGITGLRVSVRYNTESNAPNSTNSANDNSDPHVINPAGFQWANANGVDSQLEIANGLRARLAAQGETLYVVLCYVDFKSDNTFEHHVNPEEYAELIEATFLHVNSLHGWVPDAIEILLESDKTSNVDWTLSTTSPNGAKLAAALIAARNRLAQHGWFPKFIAPSTTNCDKADVIYNAMKAANPAIVQYMSELSYHRYTSAACTQAQLDEIRAVAEADGLSISMLERIGYNYLTLITDLKAGAVAIQQFALGYNSALGDDGSNYFLVNHSTHTVTIASRTKFLRQYFKYIRPGAVRIAATSGSTNFDPVAFVNTNGRYVIVVRAIAAGSFSISGPASTAEGLPAGTYGIKYTTGTQYNIDHPDQTIGSGEMVTTGIPAAGVITIYGK